MRFFIISAGLALASIPGLALSSDVKDVNIPIHTKFQAPTIVCKYPKALCLNNQGRGIAMGCGGQDASKSYFDSASRVFESSGECQFDAADMDLLVTSVSVLTNPMRALITKVIYGRFMHPNQYVAMFAILEDLPVRHDELGQPAGDDKSKLVIPK